MPMAGWHGAADIHYRRHGCQHDDGGASRPNADNPWTAGLADVVGRGRGRASTPLRPAGDDVLEVWPMNKQVASPWNIGAESLKAIE